MLSPAFPAAAIWKLSGPMGRKTPAARAGWSRGENARIGGLRCDRVGKTVDAVVVEAPRPLVRGTAQPRPARCAPAPGAVQQPRFPARSHLSLLRPAHCGAAGRAGGAVRGGAGRDLGLGGRARPGMGSPTIAARPSRRVPGSAPFVTSARRAWRRIAQMTPWSRSRRCGRGSVPIGRSSPFPPANGTECASCHAAIAGSRSPARRVRWTRAGGDTSRSISRPSPAARRSSPRCIMSTAGCREPALAARAPCRCWTPCPGPTLSGPCSGSACSSCMDAIRPTRGWAGRRTARRRSPSASTCSTGSRDRSSGCRTISPLPVPTGASAVPPAYTGCGSTRS